MSFCLEWKKGKKTGFLPAFLGGGLLAAAVPVMNMAVRSAIYTGLDSSPMKILFDGNWQMMAMLNILLIVMGACILYHTEYVDNAIQRMCTLPIRESTLFWGKFGVITVTSIVVLAMEALAMVFCVAHWFELTPGLGIELLKCFGYACLLMLPTISCSLLAASLCKNMWVSLGIGVVCVFTATLLPTDNFLLSLFPFALPFQMFEGTAKTMIYQYVIATVVEVLIIAFAESALLKVRRSME